MNVAFDPWIPVVSPAGKQEFVSLCTAITEGNRFADLAVRPHERVALMRLFLSVSHAALKGPKNYSEWKKVPQLLPRAVENYLGEWGSVFELFHKVTPWLQVSSLSKKESQNSLESAAEDWTPLSKLNFSLATGNNSTLFDHGGMAETRAFLMHDTIVSMLTYQCFSPGGLISQVFWNGDQSGKSSKDAPCVTASMLHAFLRGKNLLETIHLNLPMFEDIHLHYGDGDLGRPVWELPPKSMTDLVPIENATKTYIGRLVPMTRLIRLHSSRPLMLMGDGLVYPSYTDGFPQEPTATIILKQKGKEQERKILSYSPSKGHWRQLSAVIIKRKAGGTGGPLSLQAIQDGHGCDLIIAAFARDQATIVDTAESLFHIPPLLQTEIGTTAYDAEVKAAEAIASRLGWAIDIYRGEIDCGWEGKIKRLFGRSSG